MQDKFIIKDFFHKSKINYAERFLLLDIDQDTGEIAIDKLFDRIRSNQVIELSFRAVRKMSTIFRSIDFKTQYDSAKSIRDYKRAIFYYEEYLRGKELDKTYNTLIMSRSKQIPV